MIAFDAAVVAAAAATDLDDEIASNLAESSVLMEGLGPAAKTSPPSPPAPPPKLPENPVAEVVGGKEDEGADGEGQGNASDGP